MERSFHLLSSPGLKPLVPKPPRPQFKTQIGPEAEGTGAGADNVTKIMG